MNKTLLLMSLFCLFSMTGYSAEQEPSGNAVATSSGGEYPLKVETLAARAGDKLLRGLTNVVTGVGEIPRQLIISYREHNSISGLPSGFFTGLIMTIARTVYGGFEVLMFPIPIDGSYASMITPAYVWGPITSVPKHPPKNQKTKE